MKDFLSFIVFLSCCVLFSCQNNVEATLSNESILVETAKKTSDFTKLIILEPADENCGNCHVWHLDEFLLQSLDYESYDLSLKTSPVSISVTPDSQATITMHESTAFLSKQSYWKLQSSNFTNQDLDSIKYFLSKLNVVHDSLLTESLVPKYAIDTTIDNWRILFEPEPQGVSKWQWSFSKSMEDGRFTTLYFNKQQKFLWRTTVYIENGHMMLEPPLNKRLGPPVSFSRIQIK